ncbi:winged helix-turn-helix domain-containing protein [Rudanella lutea]|jgi:hypothetical protein|uniref:winged helix-turn-helix domain-containing protein n=1 Tax=Rudanella lutea TaxID=451374 RepID=UPI000373A17E|nr:response regulator transcription factor [Rudanella lutea]
MKQTRLFGLLALGPALLLAGWFTIRSVEATPSADRNRADAVNLALRRTAHHLLRHAGDSTSRIAPVSQPDAQTFRLTLSRSFNYDQLPRLLQASFEQYQIRGTYDVAVLDCATQTLQLGYTASDLLTQETVPCSGRDQQAGCSTLQITFRETPPATSPAAIGWGLASLALLMGFVYTAWPRPNAQPMPTSEAATQPQAPAGLTIGSVYFDPNNQTVRIGEVSHTLTYREAKLLRLFAEHPNELLTREAILGAVWEDEGVTVGRSVDVFVSRLRKLLQPDPTLKLVAVHGVGYRLTVANW